jgi:hypothetical protein
VLVSGYGSGAAINITTYLTTRYAECGISASLWPHLERHGLGAGLGPLIAGRVYDYTGDYTPTAARHGRRLPRLAGRDASRPLPRIRDL